MIFLTPKQSQKKKKKSEIIVVSLWPPSSPDYNSLDYAIWGVIENKTNATSHRNIEEWNIWRIHFEDMQIVSKGVLIA